MKHQYWQRLLLKFLCLLVFFAATCQCAFAEQKANQDASTIELPQLPLKGEKLQDFIPDFWIVEFLQQEDLNGDGELDTVMVVRNQDIQNINHIGDDTSPLIDTNPRILIILFRQGKEWRLIKQNTTFIPKTENDNGYIQDPFNGIVSGGVTTSKGIISIRLGYFSSELIYKIYTFRWQNNDFYLIGYDSYSRGRASGIETTSSYNFLTNRQNTKIATPLDDDSIETSSDWQKLKPHKLLKLDEIMSGDIDEYLKAIAQ